MLLLASLHPFLNNFRWLSSGDAVKDADFTGKPGDDTALVNTVIHDSFKYNFFCILFTTRIKSNKYFLGILKQNLDQINIFGKL